MRVDSFKAENIHEENYSFEPGNSVVIREGDDITLIPLGTMVHEALEAHEELQKQGIHAEIISVPSIRPLNPEGIIKSLKKTGQVITLEEHSIHGGIGSIIGDIILENQLTCRIKKCGVPVGEFAPASPRIDTKIDYNLHKEGIVKEVLALRRK
jgi:transketolase